MADEKKGITVKIDASLHAEIREFIEANGMTMADFVSQALYNELHPKIQPQEVKNMGPTRTMAFQMPEDMFQRLKDYLHRHGITQKEFVLGLVEAEIKRDEELINAQNAAKLDETAENISDENWAHRPTAPTLIAPSPAIIMVSIMLPVVISRFCRATGRAIAAVFPRNSRQGNLSFTVFSLLKCNGMITHEKRQCKNLCAPLLYFLKIWMFVTFVSEFMSNRDIFS